jgi:hypothetical protein
VYEALEADGWTVHPMFKVWPRSENKRLDDDVWIPKVTEYGWIILAKDEFDKGNERLILRDSGARAFCIFNATLKAEVMTQRFLNNKEAIENHAGDPGPYLYAVQTDRLRKVELP